MLSLGLVPAKGSSVERNCKTSSLVQGAVFQEMIRLFAAVKRPADCRLVHFVTGSRVFSGLQ